MTVVCFLSACDTSQVETQNTSASGAFDICEGGAGARGRGGEFFPSATPQPANG